MWRQRASSSIPKSKMPLAHSSGTWQLALTGRACRSHNDVQPELSTPRRCPPRRSRRPPRLRPTAPRALAPSKAASEWKRRSNSSRDRDTQRQAPSSDVQAAASPIHRPARVGQYIVLARAEKTTYLSHYVCTSPRLARCLSRRPGGLPQRRQRPTRGSVPGVSGAVHGRVLGGAEARGGSVWGGVSRRRRQQRPRVRREAAVERG
mmetsp:Transcript_23826/g.58425  ORF Transcript_23826/g.58425 Transcript_23826/m.58425 type:complete len:206 (-) Transcript_23826:659-1276(-)